MSDLDDQELAATRYMNGIDTTADNLLLSLGYNKFLDDDKFIIYRKYNDMHKNEPKIIIDKIQLCYCKDSDPVSFVEIEAMRLKIEELKKEQNI